VIVLIRVGKDVGYKTEEKTREWRKEQWMKNN